MSFDSPGIFSSLSFSSSLLFPSGQSLDPDWVECYRSTHGVGTIGCTESVSASYRSIGLWLVSVPLPGSLLSFLFFFCFYKFFQFFNFLRWVLWGQGERKRRRKQKKSWKLNGTVEVWISQDWGLLMHHRQVAARPVLTARALLSLPSPTVSCFLSQNCFYMGKCGLFEIAPARKRGGYIPKDGKLFCFSEFVSQGC